MSICGLHLLCESGTEYLNVDMASAVLRQTLDDTFSALFAACHHVLIDSSEGIELIFRPLEFSIQSTRVGESS